MRALFAWMIALLVGLSAVQPACAHAPPATPVAAMHHRGMAPAAPSRCDHDAVASCLGCGLAAEAPADLIAAPLPVAGQPPAARIAAACLTAAPELADPPPRLHG